MHFKSERWAQTLLAGALAIGTAAGTVHPQIFASEEAAVEEEVFQEDSFMEETDITRESDQIAMYRLYNPNSGEHFYTANSHEKDNLFSIGWRYEGTGWVAPASSDQPVYRLYNPNVGDHHYTMSAGERDMLKKAGWRDEGIGWYSDSSKRVPLYRQYNPNAKTGTHNYTTSKGENDHLCKIGWRGEGIGWYAIEAGKPVDQTTLYKDIYRPVVENVRKGLRGGNVASQYRFGDPIQSESMVSYALQDMNGDSIPELAITDNYDNSVCLLYTTVGNKPVYVTSGWSRSHITYIGGRVAFNGSGGMYRHASGLFTLGLDGRMNWSQYNFSIENSSFNGALYYTNTTGSDNPSDSVRISEGEFFNRARTITGYPSKISCSPLSSY